METMSYFADLCLAPPKHASHDIMAWLKKAFRDTRLALQGIVFIVLLSVGFCVFDEEFLHVAIIYPRGMSVLVSSG